MTHIKAAYDLGINAFDTADVYSNGLSEVVLGKAIKKYNLPRDEIVIMTKFHGTVQRDPYAQGILWAPDAEKDKMRYTNQCGGGRKVGRNLAPVVRVVLTRVCHVSTYLQLSKGRSSGYSLIMSIFTNASKFTPVLVETH